MRLRRPLRIFGIGSGNSTRLVRQALAGNLEEGHIERRNEQYLLEAFLSATSSWKQSARSIYCVIAISMRCGLRVHISRRTSNVDRFISRKSRSLPQTERPTQPVSLRVRSENSGGGTLCLGTTCSLCLAMAWSLCLAAP